MSLKCECCKHFVSVETVIGTVAKCTSTEVSTRVDRQFVTLVSLTELEPAREICDREGDGHFVYFRPKHPQAGACFVQLTRNCRGCGHSVFPNQKHVCHTPKAMAAAAGDPFSRRGSF